MSSHTFKSRYRYLAAAALLAAASASCGDDDTDDVATGQRDRFCAALVETYTTTNRTFAGIDFETTSEEDFGQILSELRQKVEPLFEEIEANAPTDLAGVVERRLQVGRQALETGEEDETPEAREAERVLDEFALSECDVQSHDVTMTEYAFSGLPDEINAGVTAFNLTNGGGEQHDFGIYLVPDGATGSPPELLASKSPSLERVGGTDLPPGEGVATFVDLTAGRYVIACLLPVDPDAEDSLTHASHGMVAELVVERPAGPVETGG